MRVLSGGAGRKGPSDRPGTCGGPAHPAPASGWRAKSFCEFSTLGKWIERGQPDDSGLDGDANKPSDLQPTTVIPRMSSTGRMRFTGATLGRGPRALGPRPGPIEAEG